ncbi:unnamed protein product, partial [marine sediment metagenome]
MRISNIIIAVLFSVQSLAQSTLDTYLSSVRVNNELLAAAREY